MRHADNRRVVESQRDGSNGLNTAEEAVNEFLLVDVKDRGREDVALVEDLHDGHTVGERRDVQHIEQRRLGRTDTGASSDDLDVGDDFNRTTGNLGRNVQSLEEGGLARLHTGVAGRDEDILGCVGTGTRGGSDNVRNDDLTDLLEVARGEDETDVALDVGKETLELRVLRENGAESAADHGILTHQNDTLATKGDTDLMHLVGTDIVDIDQEDRGLHVKSISIYLL